MIFCSKKTFDSEGRKLTPEKTQYFDVPAAAGIAF